MFLGLGWKLSSRWVKGLSQFLSTCCSKVSWSSFPHEDVLEKNGKLFKANTPYAGLEIKPPVHCRLSLLLVSLLLKGHTKVHLIALLIREGSDHLSEGVWGFDSNHQTAGFDQETEQKHI